MKSQVVGYQHDVEADVCRALGLIDSLGDRALEHQVEAETG